MERITRDRQVMGGKACVRGMRVTVGMILPSNDGHLDSDPTYLMAGVTVERTYKLLNITRSRFETLLHRVLDLARADVEITDRFGNPMHPWEWILVPLFVIDQVVDAIVDGTIHSYRYDPAQAKLV